MSSLTRRDLLVTGAAVGGAIAIANAARAEEPAPHAGHAPHDEGTEHDQHAQHAASGPPVRVQKGKRDKPAGWLDTGTVITPNGSRLPWKVVAGVKVFHLIAEAVEHEMVEGLTIQAWGYNGQTPGPTIEVEHGDRCRFYVTNRLPEPTTIHWHGMFLPNGMDGVGGLTQKAIPPGETYVYEFTMSKPGTFMYHPHFDEMIQIALGMQGMIVVHPRGQARVAHVRDYALMLGEWKIVPGSRRPDPLAMNDFNMLTFNSKAFPSTEPLVAERGDLVRIRMGNLGPMDHHPIHVHGHAFEVVETDGGRLPKSARIPETTVLVPVGAVRVVEFRADAPGDWPLHCHMTHHVMNQMGHDSPVLIGADLRAGEPRLRKLLPGYMTMGETGMGVMAEMGMPEPENSVPMKGGPGPFGLIDMGGMFTVVKIRERLTGPTTDPGFYTHPEHTVASPASAAQLRRDGVDLDV